MSAPQGEGSRRAHVAGDATRELLIITAERLFALRGLDGVSLREIGAAAGQRNTRVTQYHFGSKEGLVRAIFEYRLPSIDARRSELLGILEDEGRLADLRGLVEALVIPMAEDAASASRYVGFLERMAHTSLTEHPYGLADPRVTSSGFRIRDLLEEGIPHVPKALRSERFLLGSSLAVSALATWQERRERGAGDLDHDVVVAHLIDTITALFMVDASTETRLALRRASRRRLRPA